MNNDHEKTTAKLKKYPFDYEQIRLGQKIPRDTVAEIVGHDPGTTKYQLEALKLVAEMTRRLEAIYGHTVVVRSLADGIHIMTNEDAALYLPDRFRKAQHDMDFMHRRGAGLPMEKLSARQRSEISKELLFQRRLLSAIRQETRAIRAEVHTMRKEIKDESWRNNK